MPLSHTLPPPTRGGEGGGNIDTMTVVTLVLGTATLLVAVIGLMVKIIELTRH